MQQQGNCGAVRDQPPHRQTALTHPFSASGNQGRAQTSETGNRHVSEGADGFMPPRDRLTSREAQVAELVWEGLTNREIGQRLGTTEQVVKNYLRTPFDKLGVWSRLELALYVAGHGGVRCRDSLDSLRDGSVGPVA